jgi:hypothetical protein
LLIESQGQSGEHKKTIKWWVAIEFHIVERTPLLVDNKGYLLKVIHGKALYLQTII